MSGHEKLLAAEDRWQSAIGGWDIPQNTVWMRNKNLFTGFRDESWVGLLLYAITGRELDTNTVKMMEASWKIAISYPEPRIWVNRVASLAGTARTTGTLDNIAASAVFEATILGQLPFVKGADFFTRLKKAIKKQGLSLEDKALSGFLQRFIRQEIKVRRALMGYGRPVNTSVDERIQPMMEIAKELNYDQGLCLQLAFRVEKILVKKSKKLHMNIAAILMSIAVGLGFSAREIYHFFIFGTAAGSVPCYMDAVKKAEGTFFHYDVIV